jgi:rhamnosyltransferase
MTIACMIPTYNGKAELVRLLQSLSTQTIDFDIVIVDSSSSDGTAEIGRQAATHFVSIPSRDFNHGGTRQMLVDRFSDYSLVVFLTQDAVLAAPDAIERLVATFDDPEIDAVCGRQLPHIDANVYAQHARYFNYPAGNRIVGIDNIATYGLKSAFMSNSFAAYRRDGLIAAGGFPANVILAEDMYVAAKMILSSRKVAYNSEAQCRHSHNYTFAEEFKRYFDLGVFHAREPWIRERFGGAGGEGKTYVISELKFLGLQRLLLWPSSLARNFVRLVGYKIGQQEASIPVALKRKISMHRGFWA